MNFDDWKWLVGTVLGSIAMLLGPVLGWRAGVKRERKEIERLNQKRREEEREHPIKEMQAFKDVASAVNQWASDVFEDMRELRKELNDERELRREDRQRFEERLIEHRQEIRDLKRKLDTCVAQCAECKEDHARAKQESAHQQEMIDVLREQIAALQGQMNGE